MRDYRPVTPEAVVSPIPPAAGATAIAAPAPIAQLAADPLREFVVAPAPLSASDLVPLASEAVTNSEAAGPGRISPAVALFDPVNDAASVETPSARTIAANFAAAQAADPGLARRFPSIARGYESRALPARTPAVDPLAQMAPPSESRRSRHVVSAMPASYHPSPVSSEKIVRRITDERLYDQVTRFGASGNLVNMKF